MMRRRLASFALVAAATPVWGQAPSNPFPAPIPKGPVKVKVEEVAVLPDSTPGSPARMSVLAADPLGRLFVNDQRGPLHLLDGAGGSTEYLDLRDVAGISLNSGFEPGFQSFAFHPQFISNGKFYTIHSDNNRTPAPDFVSNPPSSNSFDTVLLEWTTSTPGASTFTPADPFTPFREVMRLEQPRGNHNSGLIAFNTTVDSSDTNHPDYGNLYIAIGDGGGGGDPFNNSQDTGNPFGAILRIDPLGTNSASGAYGLVAANQFATDPEPASDTLPEIYAYGLRNPQRFGWDSSTGKLFAADIGQNQVEEINEITNGGNYGWDVREGSFGGGVAGAIDPVAEYDHTNTVSSLPTTIGNRAVTMGEVYRGAAIPGLDGKLLLSDFPTGLLFTLDVDNDPLDGGQDGLRELDTVDASGDSVRVLELINASRAARGLGTVNRADTRYSVGVDGEVYVLNKQDGVVRRLFIDPAMIGDYNGDGAVDAADYTIWRDGDAPDSGPAGYDLWADHFGITTAPSATASFTIVPEPVGLAAALAACGAFASRLRHSTTR